MSYRRINKCNLVHKIIKLYITLCKHFHVNFKGTHIFYALMSQFMTVLSLLKCNKCNDGQGEG